jgi:hypothetical protein
MATLYITEFSSLSVDSFRNQVVAPSVPPVTEQSISITGSSSMSNTFNNATRFIMVNCDSACSLGFAGDGDEPVAVTTAHRLAANETRFYGVLGRGASLAVIANV